YRYDALPAQEKEARRQAWRKMFYKKFAADVNWASKDYKFWNHSETMHEGAKAVFELAESKHY
ncbi:hypothetical protein A2U01_0069993, partial [Trifolium medium]|nr:hypothetical protein [Trifolium medium]